MAELCIENDEIDVAMQSVMEPWCKENNVPMFVNTMWVGLCSTKPDCETTWAEMLDRGYTVIQTDRPCELSAYLHDYNRVRSANEKIEAEHFHLFNYDIYSFEVSAIFDENLNKQIANMESGDWVSYRKIHFTGDETVLNVYSQGLKDDTALRFYIDGMTESNLIAEVAVKETRTYEEIDAFLKKTVSGEHEVYIQAIGEDNTALASVDYFSFMASDVEGTPTIASIVVETTIGKVPVLPQSAKVTIAGNIYKLFIDWEYIEPEMYAQAGKFEARGYIPELDSYVYAEISVQRISGPSEMTITKGLALWFDASKGILENNGVVSQWQSQVGNITATVKCGSPTLVNNAVGNQNGIYFSGEDAMSFSMPEDFWNGKEKFTVLLFTASELTTQGSSKGTTKSGNNSQNYSVLYFKETANWGSAYFTSSQNEIIYRFGSGKSNDYGTTYTRNSDIGTAFTSTAIRKDGLSNSIFIDGEMIFREWSQSDGTKNISSYGEIGSGKNADKYYKGTICQILVYDRALSNSEIVEIQQWMADKYTDEISSDDESFVTDSPVASAEEGKKNLSILALLFGIIMLAVCGARGIGFVVSKKRSRKN